MTYVDRDVFYEGGNTEGLVDIDKEICINKYTWYGCIILNRSILHLTASYMQPIPFMFFTNSYSLYLFTISLMPLT